MPHIDMSTKPDYYIMLCVGIATHSKLISLYACAGDVGVVIPTPMPHIQN